MIKMKKCSTPDNPYVKEYVIIRDGDYIHDTNFDNSGITTFVFTLTTRTYFFGFIIKLPSSSGRQYHGITVAAKTTRVEYDSYLVYSAKFTRKLTYSEVHWLYIIFYKFVFR